MKLSPVDIKDIVSKASARSYRKAISLVEEFIQSGHDAVELVWEDGEYASPASVSSTYSKAVNVLKANCFVVIRNGRVYMVRKDPDTMRNQFKI